MTDRPSRSVPDPDPAPAVILRRVERAAADAGRRVSVFVTEQVVRWRSRSLQPGSDPAFGAMIDLAAVPGLSGIGPDQLDAAARAVLAGPRPLGLPHIGWDTGSLFVVALPHAQMTDILVLAERRAWRRRGMPRPAASAAA